MVEENDLAELKAHLMPLLASRRGVKRVADIVQNLAVLHGSGRPQSTG